MSLVASHEGGEACVCDLNAAFDLSQPTISHHLKVLHEAGLLDREKRGVWVYYRARTEALANLGALIGDRHGMTSVTWRGGRWPSSSAPRSWSPPSSAPASPPPGSHRNDVGLQLLENSIDHRRRPRRADPRAATGLRRVQPGRDPGRAGLRRGHRPATPPR